MPSSINKTHYSSKMQPNLQQASIVPPRSEEVVGKVELVEAGGRLITVREPNNSDLMVAIAELSKSLHQISKNQQVLEARLQSMAKRLAAVDSNVIMGANWLGQWIWWVYWYLSFQVAGIDEPAASVPANPHWK